MGTDIEVYRTKHGVSLLALAQQLYDGARLADAARTAGSKATSTSALVQSARHCMLDPRFPEAVEKVRRERDRIGFYTMARVTARLLDQLESENWRESQGAAAELRKICLGDSRLAGLAERPEQAAASSFLAALARAVQGSGARASITLEPGSPPPPVAAQVVDVTPEPEQSGFPLPETARSPGFPEDDDGSTGDGRGTDPENSDRMGSPESAPSNGDGADHGDTRSDEI